MLKRKLTAAALSLVLSVGILAGCSSGSGSNSTEKLVDGVYKVEYENFDSHDYKAQLELSVSGGKITDVKFDEVKKDGTLKSKDENYKKSMEEQSKTYPEKAYNELKEKVISKQSSQVDAVAGATASSKTFNVLLKYAVNEMAKKGVTTPAKIK